MTTTRTTRHRRRGQGLVEFSLALIPFLVMLMGIVDLGRGIYMSSGTSEAAREIARATAVHLCSDDPCSTTAPLGTSSETLAVFNTQKALIPGITTMGASVQIQCTDVNDNVITGPGCEGRNFVRVTVTVGYAAMTPILSMVAPTTLSSTAHVQVP
jgi:Flp pilus assembly protein TadG